MKSIQARLLVSLLVLFGALWSIITLATFIQPNAEVEEVFDAQLAQAAAVLDQISLLDNTDEARATTRLQREVYGHRYEKKVAFQIWRDDKLLLRSANAPSVPMSTQAGYSDETILEMRWRVFHLDDNANHRQIMVGELYEVRDELIREITFNSLYPLTLFLPVLIVMIWLGARRSLQPVRLLAQQVGRRSPENLEPVRPEISVPVEIQPLIDAINSLFDKLRTAFERERLFTADAAHELRTPLASIKTQAQVALRASKDKDRSHALQQIIAGVGRATHMIQQLLASARLDPDFSERDFSNINITQIARQLITEMEDEARQKNIQIDFVAHENQLIPGNQAALNLMLRNLISNAIRYTPMSGKVTVEISPAGQDVILKVIDTGPGIPLEERERVFERFYRGEEVQHIIGSGLGLSIVKRVAQLHRATIRLEQPKCGIGLCVEVRFVAMTLPPF